MWSVGCIIGELLIGRPIFPGDSTMNQIKRILEFTGLPSKEDIESINSEYASTMIDNLEISKKKDIREFFPNVDDDVLDLLRKTLQFNPNKRITVEDALNHQFVSKFHDPQSEPFCPSPVSMPVSDDKQLGLEDYRELLYKNIIEKQEISSKSKRSDSNSTKFGSSSVTRSSSATTTTSSQKKTNSPSISKRKSSSKSKIKSKLSKEEKEQLKKEKREEKKRLKEEKERKKKEESLKKKEEKEKKKKEEKKK